MQRLAALVAAVILVGGCGTSDSSLSNALEEGVWVTNQWSAYIEFMDDGSYGVGKSPESAAPDDGTNAELEWGTWSTDGDTLSFTTDPTSSTCADMVGTYAVDVVDDGDTLDVTVLDDECATRRVDFGSGLTRDVEDG